MRDIRIHHETRMNHYPRRVERTEPDLPMFLVRALATPAPPVWAYRDPVPTPAGEAAEAVRRAVVEAARECSLDVP